MNRDEVILMAREAGFQTGVVHGPDGNPAYPLVQPVGHGCMVELERFASLVAAAERRKHQSDIEAWKAEAATAEKWRGMALAKDPMHPGKAVQEIQRESMEREREACAKLAAAHPMPYGHCHVSGHAADMTASSIARAIRARSKP